MATIWITISGKIAQFRIAKFICMPEVTSARISKIASRNTALPEAPAADSNASGNGTPAAKVVDKVLA